jgi:rSAM/selenodomain-associated transferase 1
MSMDAVVIMAKAPEAHKVKTRLTPPLDPKTASQLYYCFLVDKLEQVKGLNDIFPMVAYTPQEYANFFKGILPAGFTQIPQTGSNLGERLANISGYLFEHGYEKVVILDSDSPNLPTGYIDDSMRCLDKTDAVIGPCLDGGYYLIGLSTHMPALFQDIPWSTPRVTELTLKKAANLGISVSLIDEWYDVDAVEDLLRLKRDLEKPFDGSFLCRNTHRMISKMDI